MFIASAFISIFIFQRHIFNLNSSSVIHSIKLILIFSSVTTPCVPKFQGLDSSINAPSSTSIKPGSWLSAPNHSALLPCSLPSTPAPLSAFLSCWTESLPSRSFSLKTSDHHWASLSLTASGSPDPAMLRSQWDPAPPLSQISALCTCPSCFFSLGWP